MAVDGKTFRAVRNDTCVKLAFLTLALSIACTAATHWSTGTASVNGQSGDVRIGLWRACATVPGNKIFAPEGTDGDCRYGHCIESFFFTPNSRVDDHNLCGDSKAAAAFSIITVILSLLMLYQVLIRPFSVGAPSHGFALIFSAMTVLTSFLSWVVWLAWSTKFNNDGNRSSVEFISFSKLQPGACTILMIICTLVAIANTFLQSRHFLAYLREEAKKKINKQTGRRSQYVENPTMEPLNMMTNDGFRNHADPDSNDDDDDGGDDREVNVNGNTHEETSA